MIEPKAVDRVVDVLSVILISVAAVLTAVCGYQSGRWGGVQMRLYNIANASRIESAEAADQALGINAINVNMFLNYVDAVGAGNAVRARFIFDRFGPEMRSAMVAWIATKPLKNRNAPASPFVMRQYALPAKAEARRYEATSESDFSAALTANRHSDDFLLLTVVFAAVSFLAGMSTKMAYPRHAIVVCVGHSVDLRDRAPRRPSLRLAHVSAPAPGAIAFRSSCSTATAARHRFAETPCASPTRSFPRCTQYCSITAAGWE
jgi:hypothetical protein